MHCVPPCVVPHILLPCSCRPFTNIFNVPPRNPQGYTHREVGW